MKLDENGDVAAVTNACIGPGWRRAPEAIAHDPMAHRLCPRRGWVEKTAQECEDFELRHRAPVSQHSARLAQLADLRTKRQLTIVERDEAVDILLRVLS